MVFFQINDLLFTLLTGCKQVLSPADIEHNSGLPTVVKLKIGARVMLIRNVQTEIGLYNGALGTVTGFLPEASDLPSAVIVLFDDEQLRQISMSQHPMLNGAFPVERFEVRFPVRRVNSFVEATRLQIPLKVAFATTIHKIQGQSLDGVVVSMKGHFGPGQAYVAISRCKTLENLFITDFNSKSFKVNKTGLHALDTMTAEQPMAVPHDEWLRKDNNSILR